jgi:hypothetical protein
MLFTANIISLDMEWAIYHQSLAGSEILIRRSEEIIILLANVTRLLLLKSEMSLFSNSPTTKFLSCKIFGSKIILLVYLIHSFVYTVWPQINLFLV